MRHHASPETAAGAFPGGPPLGDPGLGRRDTTRLQSLKAGWDKPARTYKPHTRWWWPGNALTKADITWQLEQMAAQGMGGVEIMSTWKMYEKGNVEYLTPEFLDLVKHAVARGQTAGHGGRHHVQPRLEFWRIVGAQGRPEQGALHGQQRLGRAAPLSAAPCRCLKLEAARMAEAHGRREPAGQARSPWWRAASPAEGPARCRFAHGAHRPRASRRRHARLGRAAGPLAADGVLAGVHRPGMLGAEFPAAADGDRPPEPGRGATLLRSSGRHA